MSITHKIKWKRVLSHLRYCYEQKDLIKEISNQTGDDFQKYYESFCRKRNINISELNNKHRDRVNELYDVKKQIPNAENENQSDIHSPEDAFITLHNGGSEDNEEIEKHQMTADEKAVHESFSKLYKQIALKIHPDKLGDDIPSDEKQLKISMFQKVNKAFESKKYFVLLDVADELGVQTPKNYAQQTRWMKKEISNIESEINTLKNTYNFLFSETDTDNERDQLMRNFLFQVFRINVD